VVPDDLRVAIGALRQTILDLDAMVLEYSYAEPTMEHASEALLQLNLAKRDVASVYDGLAAFVSHLMENLSTKDLALSNGAQIERKVAFDRKGWRHADLARDVAHRLIESSVDMDTGEVLLTNEELVAKLLDYVQPSYWRVGELNKIGINADNYCETGEAKASLVVRKGENQ